MQTRIPWLFAARRSTALCYSNGGGRASGDILLEEDKEALGNRRRARQRRVALACAPGGSVCDGWLGGVVCSELSGKVGRELGNSRAWGKRELLHDTDMGILGLNTGVSVAREERFWTRLSSGLVCLDLAEVEFLDEVCGRSRVCERAARGLQSAGHVPLRATAEDENARTADAWRACGGSVRRAARRRGARTALVACLRMADMVVTVGRKRRVT